MFISYSVLWMDGKLDVFEEEMPSESVARELVAELVEEGIPAREIDLTGWTREGEGIALDIV